MCEPGNGLVGPVDRPFPGHKRSTARIVDEVPYRVYEHLVLDENSMSFLPDEKHPTNRDLDLLDEDDAVEIALVYF